MSSSSPDRPGAGQGISAAGWAQEHHRITRKIIGRSHAARRGRDLPGKVERLFGSDGLDETAIDTCELYVQDAGKSVNKTITVPACEDMGRIRSAQNFILAIEGKEEPLNTPPQALALMRIIDAAYKSAETGMPISC